MECQGSLDKTAKTHILGLYQFCDSILLATLPLGLGLTMLKYFLYKPWHGNLSFFSMKSSYMS